VTSNISRAVARSAAHSTRKANVTIHLRKMYVDCRYGQLHMHTSFPSSGGFDELTPVICLPPAAGAGRVFRPLLRELGQDRSVYAPDLPGCGESDAAMGAASVSEQAAAIVDLIETLRLRQVDLVGYHEGSLVAAEVALAIAPNVRRVALIGVPTADATYAAGERLPLVRNPLLLLRPHDETWETTARAETLLRGARRVDLPEADGRLLDTPSPDFIKELRDFLDR